MTYSRCHSKGTCGTRRTLNSRHVAHFDLICARCWDAVDAVVTNPESYLTEDRALPERFRGYLLTVNLNRRTTQVLAIYYCTVTYEAAAMDSHIKAIERIARNACLTGARDGTDFRDGVKEGERYDVASWPFLTVRYRIE